MAAAEAPITEIAWSILGLTIAVIRMGFPRLAFSIRCTDCDAAVGDGSGWHREPCVAAMEMEISFASGTGPGLRLIRPFLLAIGAVPSRHGGVDGYRGGGGLGPTSALIPVRPGGHDQAETFP